MSAQADINQRGLEGMGISNPRRVTYDPKTIGRRADKRKEEFLALARMTNSEHRAKRSAHGGRSKERSGEAMGDPRGYVAWNHTKLLMY